MTAPSAARRSFERTNAPPLPGLTCWNSRILKTVPSTSMWFPFLNWLVLMDTMNPADDDQTQAPDDGRLHPRVAQDGPRGAGLHLERRSAAGYPAVGRL